VSERYRVTLKRLVIGVIALLVLGSIFASITGLLFLPHLSFATGSVASVRGERLER
jgi:hypothetical protein